MGIRYRNSDARLTLGSRRRGSSIPGAYAVANPFSVQFDGVDSRIVIVDNNFDGLAAGTIEWWFKVAGNAANQKLVFKDLVIDIGLNTSGRVFGEIGGVGNLGEFAATDYCDDTWHYVVMAWDSSFLRGYVDGTYLKKVAQGGAQTNNGNTLYLGRRDTTEPYGGLLDEFRISNIARYTSETTISVQSTPWTVDANTSILLHFDEGTGLTATDASGNGNHGTLENGVAWSQDTPF